MYETYFIAGWLIGEAEQRLRDAGVKVPAGWFPMNDVVATVDEAQADLNAEEQV